MSQYIVAVIDRSQARFFTLEPNPWPDYESGPNLSEHPGISNQNQLRPQQLWANVQSGGNHCIGNQAHGYDDHRQNHTLEFERRFAHTVAERIIYLTLAHQARQLVLVAEPHILGIMRAALPSAMPKGLKTKELAKDLCRFNAFQIHQYLAQKNLLPAYCKAVYPS